jgi:type IV pilus assembly protein PilF
MKYSSLLVSVILGVLLAGCSATGGEGSRGQPSASSRDRVTESDESPETRRARVRLELASAYYSRGQLTTALDEVKLALAADPKLVSALNLRGLIYAGLGDDPLAEESFRRALAGDQQDADTLQNYGWYLCQRRRYGEADSMFGRALAVRSYNNHQRTLVTKGTCQARAGNLDQAEVTLTKAYEMDISSSMASLSLADILYKRGQYERARFYVRRVNSNPDIAGPQSLWLGARIENKLGNTSSVHLLGKQLRDRFPQTSEAVAYEKGQFDE